jgi:hypothetical protein
MTKYETVTKLNALMDLTKREIKAVSALSLRELRFTEEAKYDTFTELIDVICHNNPKAIQSFDQYVNGKAREVAQLEARTKRNV